MPKLQSICQREIVDSRTGEIMKIDSARTFTQKMTEDESGARYSMQGQIKF